MFSHSTNTASFFSVLIAALIFSLSLAGVAAAQGTGSLAQGNTSLGTGALQNNTTGDYNTANGFDALFSNTTGTSNTASGVNALFFNTTGDDNTAIAVNTLVNNSTAGENTAIGVNALFFNTTGSNNTAIGDMANVSGNLTNATAIGHLAFVNASNKIRLGNGAVTVIEGQVAFTASSDRTKKENFQPVDGEGVLGKIRGFELSSWNFIGHDPKKFRHYGPMAQDFFVAFGHDGVGQIGSETTINSGDLAGILMIAVQALEKRTAELKQKEAQMAVLQSEVKDLKAKHAYFEIVAARLEALELRNNHSIQITAEKSLGDQMVDVMP
jgi:trimeric autotransporter adhesin